MVFQSWSFFNFLETGQYFQDGGSIIYNTFILYLVLVKYAFLPINRKLTEQKYFLRLTMASVCRDETGAFTFILSEGRALISF